MKKTAKVARGEKRTATTRKSSTSARKRAPQQALAQAPKKAAKRAPKRAAPRARSSSALTIVGIGASAGGLEALEGFLTHVPVDSGMGFVVVQHLDPTHKGIMVELLQRSTAMKVMQVKDRTTVRPDCVYVIPPNRDLSILHDVLHLLDPVSPRGLRLPIDFFFKSLADDARERSVGVVLSGMGTDGTLGIGAIKGKGGLVFVQDPESAKFSGMPQSAVDTGIADVVAPVEDLPGRIAGFVRHVTHAAERGLAEEDKGHSAFEKIVILLRAQTGHDFSRYKKSTVYRRIERRMAIHQIEKIGAYVRMLQEQPSELDLLFKEMLIGVTSFFRDPESWAEITTRVIPMLLRNRAPNQPIRVWVPGCSTGEEAYSMAIVLYEALQQLAPAKSYPLQIFATDLDRDAIDKARAGVFPSGIATDVSPERLNRFFVETPDGYQISRLVRQWVIFAPQNVVMDPPFTKLDLVSCRNLLIYLTPELQRTLLPLFHYSLNPGGFLFLGSAETLGASNDLFTPLKGKARLYRRLEGGRSERLAFHSATAAGRTGVVAPRVAPTPINPQAVAEQWLVQRYAPAAVLAKDNGDIVFISGRTGKFLEPAAGKVNWNVFAMAREGLRHELTHAFHLALKRDEPVVRKNVDVRTDGGGVQVVDVTVHALGEPSPLRGLVMIVITEVATRPAPTRRSVSAHPKTPRFADLERDINQVRQELQTTREEMRASQEEASSAYEELQSANEEIQSTNEELTTSKEEMQSMNEELQTINHELQAKVEELLRLNNDMKNLLDNTEITSVFLDTNLRVRLFTAGSNRILKLIPGDVGRPIADINSDLIYPELTDDAREVMRTLIPHERGTTARDGRRFRVRMIPYRTLANAIDGVVITYSNISGAVVDATTSEVRPSDDMTAPAEKRKRAATHAGSAQ